MSKTIPQILTSGEYVQVELLLAVPSSTAQESWVRPSWRGYQPASVIPSAKITDLPVGMEFSIFAQFLASEGIWEIAAVAVTYQGGILFVAPMDQVAFATPQTPFPVKVTGIVNSVL